MCKWVLGIVSWQCILNIFHLHIYIDLIIISQMFVFRQMTPIVREWSLTHPDITWIKVEFEEHGSFAAEYGVKLVPTFLFMNDTGVKDKVCQHEIIQWNMMKMTNMILKQEVMNGMLFLIIWVILLYYHFNYPCCHSWYFLLFSNL